MLRFPGRASAHRLRFRQVRIQSGLLYLCGFLSMYLDDIGHWTCVKVSTDTAWRSQLQASQMRCDIVARSILRLHRRSDHLAHPQLGLVSRPESKLQLARVWVLLHALPKAV
ncbi:hypothetical protein C8T65DRAFT_646990 [Cerioporus squamosus]|nr:hypothetical protein C8T65DRAFT_646990 [Cerioporus squamosus]